MRVMSVRRRCLLSPGNNKTFISACTRAANTVTSTRLHKRGDCFTNWLNTRQSMKFLSNLAVIYLCWITTEACQWRRSIGWLPQQCRRAVMLIECFAVNDICHCLKKYGETGLHEIVETGVGRPVLPHEQSALTPKAFHQLRMHAEQVSPLRVPIVAGTLSLA